MNSVKRAILACAVLAAGIGGGLRDASAQSKFQNYRCVDGTQFIVGFFQYDLRAHLQLDGKAVTLSKRISLSGSRYTGRGVTLRISKAGLTTIRHAKRPTTTCQQT